MTTESGVDGSGTAVDGAESTVDGPTAIDSVTRRYSRTERALSIVTALVAAGTVLAAFLRFEVLVALLVSLGVLVLLRTPLFAVEGTLYLRTGADPDAVRADFEGPTPPVLHFQWGRADRIRSADDGFVYEYSYLFGLRSISMMVRARSTDDGMASDGDDGIASDGDIELVVSAGGRPWATYAVSIDEDGDGTRVAIEIEPTRRYPLNRLPQYLAGIPYVNDAYATQEYTVIDRDRSLRF